MNEAVICAAVRSEKCNKVRKQGFIPGVIYGKGTESINIKLEQNELRNLLRHTKKANVRVKLGDDIRHCIIREVQKDPVNGQIIHVALQAISDEDVIRLKVPVVFKGKEKLGPVLQLLQERIPEVEIMGKASQMPEYVYVDVENRKSGDKILIKDIQTIYGINILDDENEILAVINEVKELSEAV